MIVGARARIGFDFAKWNPLSSASFNTRFVWESRGRDGLVSFFPFVGLEGGYQYNGSHGGMALISAGMIFDIE
ncbi:MAG TPA: hypothetical protein PLZ86_04700 [bacterium]|nr:hypothetical protein [bacterium]